MNRDQPCVHNVSLLAIFTGAIMRELKIAVRTLTSSLNPMIFMFVVVSLVPLGLGPQASVLSGIAPGLLWVFALLSILLSLDGLFKEDYINGTLEQYKISPCYSYFLVLAKVMSHWLIVCVPLSLLSPLFAAMLSMPAAANMALVVSLLVGTAILSLLGAIGAALTVSTQKGGMLVALIILPLYIPVLIFGVSCVEAGVDGGDTQFYIVALFTGLCGALLLAPAAIAGALAVNIE